MHWTSEYLNAGEKHCHHIVEYLYSNQSEHHKLEIVETASYGRGLFLDGRIQHVEHDEYIYSESIVHPMATLLNENLQHILVVGGGPGGAIREILKHRAVKTVTQIEIDESIIHLSKQYFTHISQNYHDDNRTNIIISDIRQYIKNCEKYFDLIIYDVSEPLENSPAENIFELSLLAQLRDRLTPHGIFVTWAGSAGCQSNDLSARIISHLKQTFDYNTPYICHTQSYGTAWIFIAGSMYPIFPLQKNIAQIDKSIELQITGNLRLYDGITHHHMFLLPKDVRENLL